MQVLELDSCRCSQSSSKLSILLGHAMRLFGSRSNVRDTHKFQITLVFALFGFVFEFGGFATRDGSMHFHDSSFDGQTGNLKRER